MNRDLITALLVGTLALAAPLAGASITMNSSDSSINLGLRATVSTPTCCTDLASDSLQRGQHNEPGVPSFLGSLTGNVVASAVGRTESAAGSVSLNSRVTLTGNELSINSFGLTELSRVTGANNTYYPGTSAASTISAHFTFTTTEPVLFFLAAQFLGPSSRNGNSITASLQRAYVCDDSGCSSPTVFVTQTGLNANGVLAAGTYSLLIDAATTLDYFARSINSAGSSFAISFSTAAVPLPASVWMLLSALACLVIVRRSPSAA